jgi:hypothetical protein
MLEHCGEEQRRVVQSRVAADFDVLEGMKSGTIGTLGMKKFASLS